MTRRRKQPEVQSSDLRELIRLVEAAGTGPSSDPDCRKRQVNAVKLALQQFGVTQLQDSASEETTADESQDASGCEADEEAVDDREDSSW